jgi:transposase
MRDFFWLTDAQMERLKPFFQLSHGVQHVEGRRVFSGIILIDRNGLRWQDAPAE